MPAEIIQALIDAIIALRSVHPTWQDRHAAECKAIFAMDTAREWLAENTIGEARADNATSPKPPTQ